MTLPTAIASGAAADTSMAVRPVRAGIVAGVLAAVVLFSIYLVAHVPARVVSLLGSDTSELARRGGLRMTWVPPADVDPKRMARVAADARREGDGYVIEVPGVLEEDVTAVSEQLAGGEELTFRRVIRAREMIDLVQKLGLHREGEIPGADIESWRSEDGGDVHADHYLVGHTPDEINAMFEKAFALGWTLPDGVSVGYEYVEPYPGSSYPPIWRSYLVSDVVELDGYAIQSAEVLFDPSTDRPIVLLEFTREGGETFGRLTEEIVGEKLATMRGDRVMSAPIINAPIRGGRASITMGGSDPAQQEREARVVASVLGSSVLPRGGMLRETTFVPPSGVTSVIWLARGVIALGGGLLLGLIAWAVVRRTRPVVGPLAAHAPGGIPWSRIAVTLLAPAVVVVLGFVPVFGVDALPVPAEFDWDSMNMGLLGIGPVITAFILIEILAVIVPRWRRRRHAGPAARRSFATIVPALALVLGALQAWLIAIYFNRLAEIADSASLQFQSLSGGSFPSEEGVSTVPFIGSLLAGVAVLVAVAAVIRRWGLGNGYGALIASGWLYALVRVHLDGEHVADSVQVLSVVAPVVILVVGVALARWRIARVGELPLRVPASGISPVSQAAGLVAVVSLVAALPTGDAGLELQRWTFELFDRRSLQLALTVIAAVGWSAAFARGRRLERVAVRAGLSGSTRAAWIDATILTVAVLAALVALEKLVDRASLDLYVAGAPPMFYTSLQLVAGLATAAVLVDLVHDFRGRRSSRVLVWSLHQPQLADVVERALADADVPCHLSGGHLRAMFAFFAPFAPIDVYVRPEDATRAHAKLVELLPVE